MPDEFLHIHKKSIKKDNSIYFLIIPAIIFAVILVLLFKNLNRFSSTAFYTNSDTAVLGEDSQNP
jgi:uncharacterized protein HemY